MSLEDIDHIVVLVMENRSFDHMLGYLTMKGRTDIDGLRPELSNPSLLAGGADVRPMLLGTPRFKPGPSHDYPDVKVQLALEGKTATMKGFIRNYASVKQVADPRMVMGYHDAAALPVYDFLASNYLVCDRWFCSAPGPTHVNRAFLIAGHTDGVVDNAHLIEHFLTHRIETVFDRLSANDVSWRSYFHDMPALRIFRQFTYSLGHIRQMKQFFKDAVNGTLPSVSWIDPNFDLQGTHGFPDAANDDHPPADVSRGQRLVADIYKALASNAARWQKTLFVVTYDEHGGFFDHVEPPLRPERAPFGNPLFERFGVRVPTFLISPWVQQGAVAHDELEHTSITKTILERFCPGDPVIATMGERLAGAPSLASLLAATPRAGAPPVAPNPLVALVPAAVVGGVSETPVALGMTERSALQDQLLSLRARLLGEGMPPGSV